MTAVIDTSSLLSLVRYYFPFDSNGILSEYIKSKIENNEWIIIDKVFEECKYTAKGIVLEKFKYLSDKSFQTNFKVPYNTSGILAPAPVKFMNQLENQFVNMPILKARKLSDIELENQKQTFLESADMKQVILCLNLQKANKSTVLVTEETETSNDNKLFNKIPAICKLLKIKTIDLPSLLKDSADLKLYIQAINMNPELFASEE